MSADLDILTKRPMPVTNPVRVLVVDPAAPARAALCRAIDMEPELAVLCSGWDARRAAADAARCGAEVIVVALNPDDPRCAALAAGLEAAGIVPAVLIVGASAPNGAPASSAYHRHIIAAILRVGRAGAAASAEYPHILAAPAEPPLSAFARYH